jgi:hypothetical protein
MSNLSKGQFRSVLLVHTLLHSTDSRYKMFEASCTASHPPTLRWGGVSLFLVLDRMLLEAVTLLPRVNSSST